MASEPSPSGRGLTAVEAAERLATYGPNHLPTAPPTPTWRMLLAEMVHFFALLFWVAGALAFLAGLPELGVAVFVVVVLNGLFAFVQEERAEHAAERLRDLLPQRATVRRDGHSIDVDVEELVPGDVVVLAEGDRISADLRLEAVHALAVDTSTLTGESVAEHPSNGTTVFAGCFVLEGEGRGTVVATGANTKLAGIADLTQAQRPEPSPLRRELDRVSRIIAAVAVTVGVVFFAVALLMGTAPSHGFLFAVGVTVAVVPCGLLPTVTLSLAVGAQRMAARHALVRDLEAVESLGSTTFICTDKTGTLTRNQMSVIEVWMPAGQAFVDGSGYEPTAEIRADPPSVLEGLAEVARVARRCSTGRVAEKDGRWIAHGDPMEAAFDALARRVGLDADPGAGRERRRFPFDARRRRMSVVVDGQVLVKGAPDAVLPRCVPVEGATEALQDLAGRGLRVLAVASRPATPGAEPRTSDQAERDLVLLGLLALEDPPRAEAAPAIAACRGAGIRVGMITGDHPATALAIAREVGLTTDEERVVLGRDLPTDESELGAIVDHDGIVLARVAPEDKLRIARALRQRGHVVAMTGDGVNDAPALREAPIGVAMGQSGTDVAREAADLVLLDDNFATIVIAVEQGRSTFANVRRFLTYHLTDNVAELAPFVVWALSAGRFPLAIGVLQVLALDIGTDVLPALALGTEPPGSHVLTNPPTRRHLIDRALFVRAFGVLGPVEAVVELAAFVAVFWASGWRPGDTFSTGATLRAASGAAFTAVVFGQMANAFACRSTVRPAWQISLRTNRFLLAALGAELGMLAAFLYFPPLAELLGQAAPTPAGFAVALLAIPAVLVADTIQKVYVRRRRSRPSLPSAREPGTARTGTCPMSTTSRSTPTTPRHETADQHDQHNH